MDKINNNVNFTGQMKVYNMGERWKNIAKLFEEKTSRYPFDTFEVSPYQKEGMEIYNFNVSSNNDIQGFLTKDDVTKLMEMSDLQIVDKFKKLLEIGRIRDKVYALAGEFSGKLYKALGNESENQKVYDAVTSSLNKEYDKFKKNDSFFKDIELYF